MDKKRTTSSFRAMSTERKLESIFLFVTGRCNAKCAMCFYAQEMDKKQPDLTFDEIKKISETAGQFNRLWISGGEPTLREDLPEILELFYKNNHIKDVNIPTNGLKPDRIVEWVKRFRQNCPDCNINVSLSLDGFSTTHDTQRGVPGNFYKALETLRKIQENFGDDGKVLKNIATVITKYNIDQIEDFMTCTLCHTAKALVEHAVHQTSEAAVLMGMYNGYFSVMIACHEQVSSGFVHRQIAAAHAVDVYFVDRGQVSVILHCKHCNAFICNRIQVFAV